MRELARTKRSPAEVLDDAMWGVLRTGYRDGYAADADHLKTVEHIDRMLDAGFTMYTADPGEFVDPAATELDVDELAARAVDLPWGRLECTLADFRRRYAGREVAILGRRDEFSLKISPVEALRGVVKYGRAIAHILTLYRHLRGRRRRESFAFEVAVDETDSPTTALEHYLVAAELQRLGVRWESLAPRFVGDFFKGVDYVGDLARFRSEFREHALIAEHFGHYRLSLHSGSDKFSIYPIIAEYAGDAIHLKTSGTSYLEALRVVAVAAPAFFREILAVARRRYAVDAADYRVGADLAQTIAEDRLRDEDLPLALDQSDTRQVCHVTFGAVLGGEGNDGRPPLRNRLMGVLRDNLALYHRRLEAHFRKHVRAFVQEAAG